VNPTASREGFARERPCALSWLAPASSQLRHSGDPRVDRSAGALGSRRKIQPHQCLDHFQRPEQISRPGHDLRRLHEQRCCSGAAVGRRTGSGLKSRAVSMACSSRPPVPRRFQPGSKAVPTGFQGGSNSVPTPASGRTGFAPAGPDCTQPQLNDRSFHHGKYTGMSLLTLSGNLGGRFSRNETTPSRTSADLPRA